MKLATYIVQINWNCYQMFVKKLFCIYKELINVSWGQPAHPFYKTKQILYESTALQMGNDS